MTQYNDILEEVKTNMEHTRLRDASPGTASVEQTSLEKAIEDLQTPKECPTPVCPTPVCPTTAFQSQDTDKLNEALAKAQGEFPVIENDDSIQFMKSKYASINTIIKAVQTPLKSAGLSISHHAIRENGDALLLTVLRHSSGQWTTNRARIVPEKNDFLTYSSLVGKLKRIAFMNLLNITTQDQE